jgi:hypothetical protein
MTYVTNLLHMHYLLFPIASAFTIRCDKLAVHALSAISKWPVDSQPDMTNMLCMHILC